MSLVTPKLHECGGERQDWRVITGDATFCNRKICREITDSGAITWWSSKTTNRT